MNIANIINFDTGNARGLSVVVFVSGCTNQCPECHNRETWDFNYGYPCTDEVIEKIVQMVSNPHIRNLVISGGEPMHPNNRAGVQKIIETVRERTEGKNIIIYTGYTLDKILDGGPLDETTKQIMSLTDFIIDGLYNKNLKTKGLDYRGSTNQQCWDNDRKNQVYSNISMDYFKEKINEDIANYWKKLKY